jgi:hypothetical protein
MVTWTDSAFRRALVESARGDAPGSDAKLKAWDALQEAEARCAAARARLAAAFGEGEGER